MDKFLGRFKSNRATKKKVKSGSNKDMDPESLSEDSADELELTSPHPPSLKEPFRNELAILLMGVTGSGKSTFISRLTGQNVEIGHSLGSCTTDVQGYDLSRYQQQKVYLIDTPGFDDTQISDADILCKIASALSIYRDDNIRFAGLIYMHRITDQRVAGSSLRSLRIFEHICGEDNFSSVTLVTSMWDVLETEGDREMGETREEELKSTDRFFGKMVSKGARVMRYEGNLASSQAIINQVTRQKTPIITALQREMAETGMQLGETTVGNYLREGIVQAQKRYIAERAELDEAFEEANRERDEDLKSTISEQRRDFDRRLESMTQDVERLSVTQDQLVHIFKESCTKSIKMHKKTKREAKESREEVAQLKDIIKMKEGELEKVRQSVKQGRKDYQKKLAEGEAERKRLRDKLEKQEAVSDKKVQEMKKQRLTASFLESAFIAVNLLNPPKPISRANTQEGRLETYPVPSKGKRSKSKRDERQPEPRQETGNTAGFVEYSHQGANLITITPDNISMLPSHFETYPPQAYPIAGSMLPIQSETYPPQAHPVAGIANPQGNYYSHIVEGRAVNYSTAPLGPNRVIQSNKPLRRHTGSS
ncbi:P-loop containing nucleoside triphosphate hydrolase protein [Dendryphion nanum]|uniref:P-loop containing nucleoside triphosphate hydrolase protein n=1 Tax=Dendryphion nanum TaxID=256645 RepID=A0A9P9IIN0_9PLEO|nr:P-loop containing nucleoside triphosphate hydrolase protein [Dendryphion nanum]